MNVEAALQEALAEVWSGADLEDARAVLDQLYDRGHKVVPLRRPVPGQVEAFPLASARGLPKKANA